MVFSSTVFLFVFLPIVLLLYYALDRRFRNILLLFSSLCFYAWGEPVFVFIMMGSILVNHVFALLIDDSLKRAKDMPGDAYHRRAKFILVLMTVFNLSLFFVYKYLNFTIANLNSLLGLLKMPSIKQTNIALPIGISFFTFQAMSYVFDVYYRRGQVQKNPLNTALYVSLFPQLIAGPIVRYETIAREINERRETIDDFAAGVRRFIIGLGKKIVLANSLAVLADYAFNYTVFADLPVVTAWLGAISYTLQIYYDFSGYSDMAIGLGLMFGFHFLENFDYPYTSKSVSEFWRRWHISLGSWFRDYVYFPMGGSRVKTKKRLVFNLFVVWLLTGIWHGAAWNFIFWGLMYFTLLVFEKLTGIPGKWEKQSQKVLYRLFTLLMVMLGWIMFRADGMGNGIRYIGALFGLTGNSFADNSGWFLLKQSTVLLMLSVVLSTPVFPYLKLRLHKLRNDRQILSYSLNILSVFLYAAVFVVCISFTVTSDYNPFIYFNF